MTAPRSHRSARRRSVLRGIALLAGGAVFVAACGSTVAPADQAGAGTGSLNGDINAPGGSSGGSTQAPGTGSFATPGATSAGGTTGGSSGLSTTGGTSAGGTRQVGPGALRPGDSTPISVGVLVTDPQAFEAGANAIGVNLAIGDNKRQASAVIAYINAHGGIMGRKIAPVFYVMQQSSSPTEAQRQCDYFTQDNHVVAVISASLDQPLLLRCLAKRRVGYISDYITTLDAKLMSEVYNFAFSPGSLILDRSARALAIGLHRQGFLTGQKVGIIHYDTLEANRVVDQVLIPGLKRLGVEVVARDASSASDGSTFNQQNAVLRFRQAGVTRVLALADNPIFFMTAADSQQYYPAYGMDSNVSPGGFLQDSAPPRQLEGAHAVGVLPSADVDRNNDPGPVGPAETLCLDIMRKDGQDTTSARLTEQYMLWYCDSFFFLDEAMTVAERADVKGLNVGARSLGRNYRPAITFGADFTSRHDGASHYRDVRYVSECSCFRYFGPLRPLP